MTDSTGQVDAGLDRASSVSARRQGEVLAIPDACIVMADLAWPLNDLSVAAVEEVGVAGLAAIPHPVDLVVILTQTCDLQRTARNRHSCQLAAVVEHADEIFVRQVARGRHPSWVALPWHGDRTLGDLSRITTVERSVLVDAPTHGRPSDPAEAYGFAAAVGRHLSRAALPDHVSNVLAPLLRRMKDRHDKDSPEGRCISLVKQTRVEALPGMDTEAPDLTVLVLLDEDDLPGLKTAEEVDHARIDALVQLGHTAAAEMALDLSDSVKQREGWLALVELWVQPSLEAAADVGGIGDVTAEVMNANELSLARSLRAPELDLAYLSTRT